MTLDIAKFISNSIKTQAKVHHLEVSTKTVGAKDVPESVASLIANQYGEKYLLDADYVSFFWGNLGKDQIKSLFKVVDKALGESANRLTNTDFKKLLLDENAKATEEPDEDAEEPEEEEEEVEELDVEDSEDGEEEEEDAEEETEDEQLNEDDGDDELPAVEEEPEAPKAYFFLKTTVK